MAFHRDERGWLSEIFRDDELPADFKPVMGYVSVTHTGMTRGPHSHAKQTDYFMFVHSGQFLLRLWDNRPDSPTYGARISMIVGEDNPVLVVAPPGIVHGYRNISDTDGLVLNFPDRLYAGEKHSQPVDEVRYEDETETEFSMADE